MFYILRRHVIKDFDRVVDHVVDRYFKEHDPAYEAFDKAIESLKKNCLAKFVRRVDKFDSSKVIYKKVTVLKDDEGYIYRISIIETYFEDKPDE
jgi:hypothetical protein